MQAQSHLASDTIYKCVKMKTVFKKVNKDFIKMYNFTLKDEKREHKQYKDTFGCSLISDYNLNDLSLKVIPRFSLKEKYNLNKNIVDFFDVKQDKHRAFFYTISKRDSLLTTAYSVIKDRAIMSAILLNCSLSEFLDNNINLMMRLGFQEKYFVFQIDEIVRVLFIVDNGVVYAIHQPRTDGTYKKTEINEFFRTNKIKVKNFDSESAENLAIKSKQLFFNKPYFLNIHSK